MSDNFYYLDESPSQRLLRPAALTPEAFSLFGSVVSCPLADDINKMPNPIPSDSGAPDTPAPVVANQSTALKYSPASICDDAYGPQCKSGQPSGPRISLFACFPRGFNGCRDTHGGEEKTLEIRILERHPYTTQTFVPMGLERPPPALPEEEEDSLPSLEVSGSRYLVIVAPTLKNKVATIKADTGTAADPAHSKDQQQQILQDPPDLEKLRVFIAHGGQGVTYGAGTWHAPMIVLGRRRVDFVVFQFANGIGDEDCQEVALKEGLSVDLGVKVRAERGFSSG